ncbi:MAG: hypothetical protein ABW069_18945, partial [Duganella sp.]
MLAHLLAGLLRWLCLIWALAVAPVALAVPAAAAAVAPIPAPDILVRAEQEQQQVDLARQLLAAPAPDARLDAALDDIARPVDLKLLTTTGIALRELPIMRLESLARHWEFDAYRYARWEVEARRAFAPYADTAMQLAQRRAAWSATRAAGLLDGLPPILSQRFAALLDRVDASEAALG